MGDGTSIPPGGGRTRHSGVHREGASLVVGDWKITARPVTSTSDMYDGTPQGNQTRERDHRRRLEQMSGPGRDPAADRAAREAAARDSNAVVDRAIVRGRDQADGTEEILRRQLIERLSQQLRR
jgi:hypothetical protein